MIRRPPKLAVAPGVFACADSSDLNATDVQSCIITLVHFLFYFLLEVEEVHRLVPALRPVCVSGHVLH